MQESTKSSLCTVRSGKIYYGGSALLLRREHGDESCLLVLSVLSVEFNFMCTNFGIEYAVAKYSP